MPLIPEHWSARAACLREDPELFFPVTETGPGSEQVTLAKKICAHCPVVAECLAYALHAGEHTGIWGGTTPYERRMLRRPQV